MRILMAAVWLGTALACAAQDAGLVERQQAANEKANAAEKAGDMAGAERLFLQAVEISRQLSAEQAVARDDALSALWNFYSRQGRQADADRVLQERTAAVDRLSPARAGLVWFDVESNYAARREIDKARAAADRAGAIYRDCIRQGGAEAKTCDRRLADVQGIMGSALFNAKQDEAAEPWFKAVVDRPDDAVRPEIMLISLRAYAKLLYERGEVQEGAKVAVRSLRFEEQHPGVGGGLQRKQE